MFAHVTNSEKWDYTLISQKYLEDNLTLERTFLDELPIVQIED